MESCGPSGWINDLAISDGLKTLVCSTNEDAWKWSNVKRKTDKDDALKLARMAAMNELKAVHMPCETHREFRSLVKYRKTLDQRINSFRKPLELCEPNELWRGELDIELTQFDALTTQSPRAYDPRRVRLGSSSLQPLDQAGLRPNLR
jgi:hypothetical protein